MFAAAAVAAAAALTAISTTTAVGSLQPQTSDISQIQKPQPHVSWHQYAMQRRNSLQRRKFEIDKRIKQASAANNKSNLHSNELKQFQSNSLNTLGANSNNNNNKKASIFQSLDEKPVLTYQYSVDQSNCEFPQFELLKSLASKNGQNLESFSLANDSWIKGLNTDVCNEFLRLHSIHKDESNSSNFLNGQGSPMEMTDISQALLEFLQSNNFNEESQILNDFNNPTNLNIITNELNQALDYKKASKLAGVQNAKSKPNRRSKQKYDSVRYKWNPKWLRLLRKTTCLPVAIVTLLLLIFTNLSSNWVYIEENQRAGLWVVCKSKPDLSSPTTLKYLNDNEIDNSNSLSRKLKRTKSLFEKPKKIEECYSKFLLKDDTHLVVLALILVGFFFHLIGLVFMIIGIFFSTSNKTLYYYHSAGECLLSSALILGIDLFAFASLVSSQINQSYQFGYCFYTNLTVSVVTFFYSLIFYLDDLVNEYRNWRKKISEEDNRVY